MTYKMVQWGRWGSSVLDHRNSQPRWWNEGRYGGCGPVAGPCGEQGQEYRWEAVVNSGLEIPAEVRKALPPGL